MRTGRRAIQACLFPLRLARAVAIPGMPSMPVRAAALVASAAIFLLPAPAPAQEDFRQSEADRPLRVEDAYPLKLWEWEWEAGLRAVAAERGGSFTGKAELKTGLLRNLQLGFEIEGGVDDGGPGSDGGLESAGAHLLYGVVRETRRAPALALRADLRTPGAGPIGHEDWSAAFKGVATRSAGRLRLHGNAGYAVASRVDGGDFWLAGLGFDYPIGLFSRAVLGDVFAEIPVETGRTRVWLEIGSRFQMTNLSVLDVGLATRLDEWERGRENVELVLGLSRVFGIPGLTPVPPYPDPPLR